MDASSEPEGIPLTGGISTAGVVRVGDTVRRPLKPDSDVVHALLAHVARCGVEGALRYLVMDSRGRALLTFIEGFAPPHNGFRWAFVHPAHDLLTRMGAIV